MTTTFTAPPSWKNVGVAPSKTLKTNGFQAGYKPPAPVFNYMFNKYGICIDELQKERLMLTILTEWITLQVLKPL